MDKLLPQILPDGLFVCVQPNPTMDNPTTRTWYDSVSKLYITRHDGEAGLLMHDFIYYKSDALKNVLRDDDAHLYMIHLIIHDYYSPVT